MKYFDPISGQNNASDVNKVTGTGNAADVLKRSLDTGKSVRHAIDLTGMVDLTQPSCVTYLFQ